MESLTDNVVLCFISNHYDKLDRQNLSSIILESFSREEVVTAKQTLLSLCEKSGLSNNTSESKIKRIGANVEQKVIKDILDIWEIVDNEKGGNLGTKFVTSDINRLPSVDPEKFNLKFLISSIIKLREENEFFKIQLENILKLLSSARKDEISFSSPFLQTPGTPRRKCPPTPPQTLSSGNSDVRLNASIPSFVPRQRTDSESSVSVPSLSLAPYLPKNRKSSTKQVTAAAAAPAAIPIVTTTRTKTPIPASVASPVAAAATAAATPAPVAAAAAATAAASPAPHLALSSRPQNSPQSFASATKNSGPWNLVTARKKKKIAPVTGQAVKNNDDDLEGVPPTVRDFWDLSVSRLSETATSDKVITHLQKHGIEVRDVFILSSKIRGTKSAKVRVAREHRDRAKSALPDRRLDPFQEKGPTGGHPK